VALLADVGLALLVERGLTTTAVSVNAKEGKTQKENHMPGNHKQRVVDCLEIAIVTPEESKSIRTKQEHIHSERREHGRDAPGSTTTMSYHTRRLHLHVVSHYMCPRRWNKKNHQEETKQTEKSGKR